MTTPDRLETLTCPHCETRQAAMRGAAGWHWCKKARRTVRLLTVDELARRKAKTSS